jgi:phenylalanyl-tRNA synthetase beta chain
VRRVLAHTAALIAELSAGTAVAQALDVVALPIAPRRVQLRSARVAALLGQAIAPERIAQLLTFVGCTLRPTPGGFDVEVPTHRPDISREVDLIEELARLSGYETLPSELPRIVPSDEGTPAAIVFVRRLRETAAAAGLTEAINYSFLSPGELRAARASEHALRVVNPMSEERAVMRTSLLPGLCVNLRQAQHQQLKSFAQFELARVFHPQAGERLPEERHQLGVLLWGQRRQWYQEDAHYDFYDAKAVVEAMLRPLCARAPQTRIDDALDASAPELHPKRRARIVLGELAVGVVGELHPDVVQALELEGRPIWVLLELRELAPAIAALGLPELSALPRFPSATRDIAVVVAESLQAGEVGDALQAAAGPMAESVALFDIYRGDPVPAGHKSLAFHVVYRDPEATLTDKVVDELHGRVTRAAQQRFGGSVRQ